MSPFLDDRGRLLGRINLVDILVLLALVALLIFAVTRTAEEAGASSTIKTTFVVEHILRTSAVQLEEGARVRDDTGTVLGTITSKTQKPSLVESPNAEGQLVVDESEIYWDVTMVVEGEGDASDPFRVRIGGVPMLVGKTLILTGSNAEVRAQIRAVEVVS